MWYKSYAKINLGLNVDPHHIENTTKHKIETIMFLIDSIYDEIKIEKANNDEIIYEMVNNEEAPSHYLISSTLHFLRSKFDIKNHYKIIIKKHISIGSGLGGGSSNAAFVINKILEFENIDNSLLDYEEIALKLGSDIPFFISGYNCAYVSEFGNKIQKLNFTPNFKFNIHLLHINVNTKSIYNHFVNNNCKNCKTDFKKLISILENNGFTLQIYNDLQDSCFELFPQIKAKYNELSNNHLFCILSGSGSTLITIDSNIVSTPSIRTRYAPSPTGYFHIGGARTALFNYLYAKHNNGQFIVRIEDTDIERNVEGGIDSQLNYLKWLNINPDESLNNPKNEYGPYIQSEKLDKYKLLANMLLEKGLAYRCFCSKEELDFQREKLLSENKTPKYQRTCLHLSDHEIIEKLNKNIPYVIRLKIKDNYNYEWDDLIRGKISVPSDALTDPVILKANKIAMYNFAVVVDDYDMKISHVLRGEEHISNTPYQLAIAEALEKPMSINYGHLSIITDDTGKKLSKRNSDLKQFISDYMEIGCLPEALTNFLSLLGWSPKSNQEILDLNEMVTQFDLANVSKSPAKFDEKKLEWISNEYFKKIDNDKYLTFVKQFIDLKKWSNKFKNNLDNVLLLFKPQLVFARHLDNLITNSFETDKLLLSDESKKLLIENKDVIDTFADLVFSINDWNEDSINDIIQKTKQITNKNGKNLFMPIRLISTNLSHGCELVKSIYYLSKEKVISNIKINIKEVY